MAAFGKVKVIYVERIFAHCSLVFDRYLHKNIHKKNLILLTNCKSVIDENLFSR